MLSLPIYPFGIELYRLTSRTTIDILKESYSEKVIHIVADTNTSKYPQEIQILIRKIRIYFYNNDNPNGIRNMMGKIEEYLYQQSLER